MEGVNRVLILIADYLKSNARVKKLAKKGHKVLRSLAHIVVVRKFIRLGSSVVPFFAGRLTIPTADGDLLHYSAVASEPLESAPKAPAAEVAASSCLRRAAALAGLGLELWG